MKHLSLLTLVALTMVSSGTSRLFADAFSCSDTLLAVEADSVTEAIHVCEAAIDAKAFLSTCELTQEKPITIELRRKIAGISDHCAGVYFPGTNRVVLVPLGSVPTIMPSTSAFAQLDAGTYYDSLIVHELAHAFLDQLNNGSLSCGADSEYIAYALQIESLPEMARSVVLSHRQVNRPVPEEKLNDFVLSFVPDVFGILAWTHFSEEGNGCRFVNDLIKGDITLALPDIE